MVQGALSGSGEDPRPFAGCRRQIPSAQKVSTAEDHMGWRGNGVLFQGEVEKRTERLLPEKQVPDAGRKTRLGQADGLDANPSQQLVQEPTAARPDASATQVGY